MTTSRRTARKTYLLDTSVLLSDPRAMLRFAEHEVVLPVVVISELEAKRAHPELGYFARQALSILDDLRVEHGRLDDDCRGASQGEHGLIPSRCTDSRSTKILGAATCPTPPSPTDAHVGSVTSPHPAQVATTSTSKPWPSCR